jgi:GT2 family glycosyltransferase
MQKIVVSLLNWQHYKDCVQCVQSLEALQLPEGTSLQVLIRDNASANDSFSKLKELLPAYTVSKSESNEGYAAGHSENWKTVEKDADFFWILNCDLQVQPDTLQQLYAAWQQQGNALYGAVSMQPDNASIIDFAGGEDPELTGDKLSYNTWKGSRYSDYVQQYPQARRVQSIEGSCMFIPASVIRQHGFMATDFFMYAEETDYCLSLGKKGVPSIVVSRAKVVHHHAASFKANAALKAVPAYYRRRNYLRIMQIHFGWSVVKCLNYPDSGWSKLRFIVKYMLNSSFRKTHFLEYYRWLGSWHGALGMKGKTVNPEKFL